MRYLGIDEVSRNRQDTCTCVSLTHSVTHSVMYNVMYGIVYVLYLMHTIVTFVTLFSAHHHHLPRSKTSSFQSAAVY